ncbi:hypothetical protein GCM10009087_31940 [Sphingomonas oligophenolica]|uniref:Alkaline phosphatase family protein n=1 Tax=Sphingomonas oligophenolica TaxID=301154 RepID=A0ABU9XY68_9SPHN
MSWTGVDWTAEYPRFPVDLNGDGRADIVGCGLTGTWVSRNDGHGNFAPPELAFNDLGYNQSWRVGKHVRTTGNFAKAPLTVSANPGTTLSRAEASRSAATGAAVARSRIILGGGIHLPERIVPGLMGFGDHGTWAALSQGGSAFGPVTFVQNNFSVEQGWQVGLHPRILADLNGDGLSDIVGFGNDGVWTSLCLGGSGGAPSFAPSKFVLANFGVNQGWQGAKHVRALADLTGDRHADIIGFGDAGVWASLGTGDGGFAEAKFVLANLGYNQGWRVDRHPRFAADLTGDGRSDIVGFGDAGVWTSRGNGDGTVTDAQFVLANLGYNQGWRIEQHPRFVTDLNGDGRADLIGFGNDGVWVALGDGNGGFGEARFVLAGFGFNQGWRIDLHPRFLADITGDGRPDIVGFGDDGVWTALNNGDGTFGEAHFMLADFGAKSGRTGIKHVFVCMMENRSYDHFLGLAAINGADAHSGAPTSANGLKGGETQSYEAKSFPANGNATDRITPGPPHNFNDFMVALCGADHDNFNPNGGAYPPVNGSGYAAAYGIVTDQDSAGEVMKCFPPKNLQVLNALAQEFVVCDNWFGSMPGPTEPNRMFVHAAECDTWDDSPSPGDQAEAEILGEDISFDHGTIFDRLRKANVSFRIYAGDDFPNVAILHGISVYTDIDDYEDFSDDLHDGYDAAYTFIEPNYDVVSPFSEDFYNGNSQHPRGGVAAGEDFIKSVYETIRNSPVWNSSLLVITWDEAGGFYDHVLPPRATPTGKRGKKHGFMFDQLGTRVPAIVISPLIPRKLIEHRVLEHSVIPATVEQLFNLDPLTDRDANLVGLQSLATLKAPRTDTPARLPNSVTVPDASARTVPGAPTSKPPGTLLSAISDENFLPSLQSAAIQHMAAAPDQHAQIRARVAAIRTIDEYRTYMMEVSAIVKQRRAAVRAARQVRHPVIVRDHRHPELVK